MLLAPHTRFKSQKERLEPIKYRDYRILQTAAYLSMSVRAKKESPLESIVWEREFNPQLTSILRIFHTTVGRRYRSEDLAVLILTDPKKLFGEAGVTLDDVETDRVFVRVDDLSQVGF